MTGAARMGGAAKWPEGKRGGGGAFDSRGDYRFRSAKIFAPHHGGAGIAEGRTARYACITPGGGGAFDSRGDYRFRSAKIFAPHHGGAGIAEGRTARYACITPGGAAQ